MNPAHAHAILNAIPLIGIPFSILSLFQSIRIRSDSSFKFSMSLLIISCITVIPVYFTGGGAEDIIAFIIQSIEAKKVHEHEGSALLSLILSVLTMIAAIFALSMKKKKQIRTSLTFGALTLALATTFSLSYTAYLGGKIRHSEFHQN